MSEAVEVAGILFDLDGTLLDTEPAYEVAMGKAIESLNIGKTYTWETQKLIVGKPETVGAQIIIDHLIGEEMAKELNLTAEALLHKRDTFLLDMFLTVRPRAGALEILQTVKAAGIPVAIATSSFRKYLELKAKNNADVFSMVDAVICGDDPEVVGRGKPRPDIYIAAAKAIGVDVKKCVVFEDAEAGLKAAKSANVAKVIMSPDHRLAKELFQDADVIVDEWTNLDLNKILTLPKN